MSGTWYGQNATGIVYILATARSLLDNDLLWYAQNYSPSFVILTNQGLQSLALSTSIPVVEYHVLSTRNSIPFILTRFPLNPRAHGLAALSADDVSLHTRRNVSLQLCHGETGALEGTGSKMTSGSPCKNGVGNTHARQRLPVPLTVTTGFLSPKLNCTGTWIWT